MGARLRMTMRARVERDMASGTDPYGNPLPPDWQVLHDSLPCYLWTTAERVLAGEVSAILSDHRMMVPRSTDIAVGDRVTRVSDRQGNALLERPMAVAGVLSRADHLLVLLEGVR